MPKYIRRLIHWWFDYLYVTRWQLRAVFFSSRLPAPSKLQDGLPVVLIPGVYENWHFMWPVVTRLSLEGHPIHVIQKLGYNTGNIPEAAKMVEEYLTEHNLQKVLIVAHSKGGLVAKYAMMSEHVKDRVVHLIAINTPFSGSIYAYLFLIPSVRVFMPKSPMIRALKRSTESNRKTTSIYSEFDPHIPKGSYLEEAENIRLPLFGHFKVLGDRLLLDTVADCIKRVERP